MSVKQSLNFALQVRGDGASTSITIALTTAAMSYYAPNGQTLQPGFLITSLLPSNVDNIVCGGGYTATASIGLLNTMTINFNTAITNSQDIIVYGTLIF